MTAIPYLDLGAQYDSIKDEIDQALSDVIAQSAYVRGPFVAAFEETFADLLGVKRFLGTGNGTDALFIALRSLGIGPGDEVITAANSWIASSECISLCGATPVFADIDPATYTIDPTDVEARITPRTRAIIPVHLFGQAADMTALESIAAEHDLHIVEDCAQAHLATTNGRIVGTIGQVGAFSFYPGKNLGAYGDAGGLATGDQALDDRMRMFANHGSMPNSKHDHAVEGINSRLDGVQAAVLDVKARHLVGWTENRRKKARAYDEALSGIGDITTPVVGSGNQHVYHIYCIRTERRDDLRRHLQAADIGTGIHYPVALPFLKAYESRGVRLQDYPVAGAYQDQILSLPIYPELSEDSIDRVVETIRGFFSGKRS